MASDIDNESKEMKTSILGKLVFLLVVVLVFGGVFYIIDSQIYSTMQEELALRDRVESITLVVADVKSIESVQRRTGKLYVVSLKYEDVVSTIRTSSLLTTDGNDITEGMQVTVYLWHFKDGTDKLRLEDGTEKVQESILRY